MANISLEFPEKTTVNNTYNPSPVADAPSILSTTRVGNSGISLLLLAIVRNVRQLYCLTHSPGLLPLAIQTSAILAKAIPTCARLAFMLRDVASRRASAVIVMYPIRVGLLHFVNRVKRRYA
jgi:hypothetical protein